MSDAPEVCAQCGASPEFDGATGTLLINNQPVRFDLLWVCGFDAGDGGAEYHGPLIELRVPSETIGLATLRKLGWPGHS
ncbi:hypothetical protein ACRARG_12710 [Pseudooceanicola sp. C21-150M6]|uniref:hypothetical protein n=1 Tax=Pseudooceanicola sp. C21-150M6 TaxID=3434355 RepID=UPI003D7F69BD